MRVGISNVEDPSRYVEFNGTPFITRLESYVMVLIINVSLGRLNARMNEAFRMS